MKFRSLVHVLLAGCAALVLAGCPTNTGNNLGNTAGAAAGTAADTSRGSVETTSQRPTVSDNLAQRFPNCRDMPQSDSLRAEILTAVNRERTSRGLKALVRNPILEAQATQYACELIEFNFFAHENPVTGSTLVDRAKEFGFDFLVIGENLAAGQPTAQQAMQDWMNSAGHRANILDSRFTEVGIGVRAGGEFGTYWVQEFGLPTAAQRNSQAP